MKPNENNSMPKSPKHARINKAAPKNGASYMRPSRPKHASVNEVTPGSFPWRPQDMHKKVSSGS